MSSLPPSRVGSPAPNGPFIQFPKPFLHPNVSRLRSFTPRSSSAPSTGSPHAQPLINFSPSPSHFSEISRTSSPSAGHNGLLTGQEREVFRWSSLRSAGSHLYNQKPGKASAVLGDLLTGAPMVLTANGFICVGTDKGRIFVFDFKQTLKYICGSDSSGSTAGPVSAIALSNDHTFVASGHTTGYIQLFNLKTPEVAARTVTPVTLAAVTSGRQEGHLPGSRIISISFVAGRHTAVVSADEHGLSFYHSLGKVLFVEASDTIRIFGNYHGEDAAEASVSGHPANPSSQQNALDHLSFRRRRRPRNTVLAMTTLPLGPLPHPTDVYQIVTLLTPTKLVVVGLKPTPKTWLKIMRDEEQLSSPAYRRRGCLAWFPSVQDSSTEKSDKTVSMKNAKSGKQPQRPPTHPVLSYSWGSHVYLLRVHEQKTKQTVSNSRTGKTSEVEVGTLVFEEVGKWLMDDAVLAIQWLNVNQLAIFTASALSIYDAHGMKIVEAVRFDSSSLVSPSLGQTGNGSISYSDSVRDIAHSIRTYKGKLFLLGRQELFVGTLLSWADRILSFVEQGDFLSAIELTRTYYTGEAPGNRNGLPEDPEERQTVIADKIHDLMMASSRFTFSEDRMTDGTHASLDGRGVDRTSLFEDLVATCARACIALDDFDFLFEGLFQQYEDAGIHRMFLHQLEPFVLDGSIPLVPPRITQRLVALHEEGGRPDLAERIIWHIEPSCLDINQAINLCRTHQLWDALVYVYTRALRDYVSPIIEFLALIRSLYQNPAPTDTVIKNAYKIYSYLATVLCGQIYPSQEPLEPDEASFAKRDVYSFIFCGHSTTWPAEEGNLVLTSQDENGMEPTYPYARLLLRFDAESFLHCLDMAFEDSYLHESSDMSRLMIVRILLDIMSSEDLSPSGVTFMNIFIARNVPKYPQYLQDFIAPSVLHNVLTALATQPEVETREDRQLAAEYLLSVYTPHDEDRLLQLFEDAGFYRILRSWYRHERHWGPLLTAFLHDPELRPSEMFSGLEEVIVSSIRDNKKQVPGDIINILTTSLDELLQADVLATASLLDKHAPELHETALESSRLSDDRDQFIYLNHLVPDSEYDQYSPTSSSPSHINSRLRHRFIRLQCRFAPSGIIDVLKRLQDGIDWSTALSICEEAGAYDAVIWSMNYRGQPQEALSKADVFEKQLTLDLTRTLASPAPGSTDSVNKYLNDLQAIGRRGISVCMEHSSTSSAGEVPLEDIWYQLLSSQIHTVQALSACCSTGKGGDAGLEGEVLSTLRAIVQETFASLVSVSSTQAVSFPRLFKRLVDPAVHSGTTGTPYTEFRAILTGMLESYRTDGDMLIISKRLIDRDVFDSVELYAKEKMRGWTPSCGVCSSCGRTLLPSQADAENVQIRLSRTGTIYHLGCST
ncbi:Golgi CORVET complex core vacuolar protein 8-domain-containing protein [Suillus clintonianus]|uniref:Golgi CORVET complex core vacuolar protein 8-domain-containing protein n=1 Tax=Suillus clintonianus TaxID=1904413 RepID=UPI001B86F4C8|nr:Golgi CORVET complex core vacuolar protein 8-domain-containing protein [Suillus clintonianus]KAG2150383.1 Golgi CORVET complex core vacuolar protein 8-domain-containing protein [Suillus clintonianus]